MRQVARLVDDVDRGSSLVYGRQGGAVNGNSPAINDWILRTFILDGRVVNVQVARLIDDVIVAAAWFTVAKVALSKMNSPAINVWFSRGLIVRLDDCVVNVQSRPPAR